MLYCEETDSIKHPENEALLMQLPGTLPFTEIKPHAKNALEDILERLNNEQQAPPSYGENAEDEEMNGHEAPRIGKLRFMKSGKVVMRIQLPGSEKFVDLEMNQGI